MIRVNPHIPTRGYIVEGFNVEKLKRLRKESGEAPISVFTEKEFDLLQYAPSTLYRINLEHGLEFPIDRDNSRRQLEGDIISQYSVLDSAVQGSYYKTADFIHNKATSFLKIEKRIGGGGGWYSPSEFPSPEELNNDKGIPIPFGLFDYSPAHIPSITDRVEFIYQLKQTYSKLIGKQRILDENRIKIRSKNRREKMRFSLELEEIFGKNIDIVMFGSATYEDSKNDDYDFIVLTDYIRKEHLRDYENANLRLNDKPVDVVLVRKKYWENYVVKNPFSQGIVRDGIVIQGSPEFPQLDMRESALRSLSRSIGRIRALHGVSLNWAGLRPHELVDKPGLLASLSKVPSYVLRGLLELRDLERNGQDGKYTKSDLEEILLDIGVRRVDFNKSKTNERLLFPEQDTIQESLYEIMVQAAHVVDKFYVPNWIGNHKEQIDKVNNPNKEFLDKIQYELEMEKFLYDAWNIAEVK